MNLKFISLLLICLLCACQSAPASDVNFVDGEGESYVPDGERARVVQVIDGDTIIVQMGASRPKVRYIGVDTPERDEPYYKEASGLNRDLVGGETIIMVKDVSDTDRYGRLLRYIYLQDGTFVNEELLAQGYARTVTFPPDVSNADYFAQIQREARDANLGLWGGNELINTGTNTQTETNNINKSPGSDYAGATCPICDRNAYDCKDFKTHAEAQACHDSCWEIAGEDIHNLDGGGDGLACERLP